MRDGEGFPGLKKRFLAKVRKTAGCWEWTAAKARGYGRLSVKKPIIAQATWVAWELFRGPIPKNMWVLHKCDNRGCVKPAHLFLGVQLDNIRDCISKGRFRPGVLRGKDGPNAKLTTKQVRKMRLLSAAGMPRKDILKRFPTISYQGLGHILRRECWKYV
jgi:hypothetical protein